MNKIFFSIVIPLYNKQDSIANTLKSVLSQNYSNYEIVVVDDGSTDNSAAIAIAILREYNECTTKHKLEFRVICKPNGGVSSARNRGIQEAKYEYIALLDGDDVWDEHYLEEQVKLIHDFPNAKMWGVNYADVCNGNVFPYQQGVAEDYREYVNNYFGTNHGDLFWTSAVVLKKDIAEYIDLFDERMAYSEDMDLWYRIILQSKVVFYNKVLAYYNKDAENRAEQNFHAHFEIKRRMEYYLDKYVVYFKSHPAFAKFISLRVAWLILQGNYYFGNQYDREATDKIVKYLAYEHMPYKYRLIFRTPRCVGRIVYELTKVLKRIRR